MGGWGPPLRLARRTARRSVGRTLLVAALIGLPVFVASWLGLIATAVDPSGEVLATRTLGTADARLDVTPYRALSTESGPPRLDSGYANAVPGANGPQRDAAKVDPLSLLPPASKVARGLVQTGTVSLRIDGTTGSAPVVVGDGRDPLTSGTYRLDSGQLPATVDQVAVSPTLADQLGLLDGDELRTGSLLTTADGKRFAVTGVARTVDTPNERTVFAVPRTTLLAAASEDTLTYLVDLPDSADPGALVAQAARQGGWLLPRANVVDPPPSQYVSDGAAGSYAAMILVVAFGVLEIVLLAGTAFAVGARRQARELGLVTAAGGTPRDVHRIVLAQGLFAGLLGSLSGLLLAVGLVVGATGWWENALGVLINGWQIPWGRLTVIATIGLLAGLAAAVVPAVTAGRQSPIAALSGKFAVAAGNTRLRRPALMLLAGGIAASLVGSALIGAALAAARRDNGLVRSAGETTTSVTPTGPIALVLLGITCVIAALVWMLPNLVAKAASMNRVFPLSARLAMRDAARHRHRTGPATAAIMMAVAGTAAVAFAMSNSFAADAVTYVPQARDGDAVVWFDNHDGAITVPYSAATLERVAGALPVERTFQVGAITPPGARTHSELPGGGWTPSLSVFAPPNRPGQTMWPLVVVEPDYLDRFGDYGKKAAAALRNGKVVVPTPDLLSGGQVRLAADDEPPGGKSVAHAAVAVGTPPTVEPIQGSLISPDSARRLGAVRITQAQFELSRDPTDGEVQAVARMLGTEDALRVEHGYHSPATRSFLILLAAATVVTLLGVAISVSLSAAEGRADLATLAAVGAPPRRRRSLAAAQAWVLGQLGCVLGVGVGALYGYTAHAAFGSPSFVVPWREIGGIVVAVPLFAGLLAWLLTRSRLPMVSRIE